MNSNLLINIPHSSFFFPSIFFKKLLIDNKTLEYEKNILTDVYTDDIFSNPNCNIIKCNFSRIFCDIERFKDDNIESMSKIGMGAIYTKTTKHDNLINITNEYKSFVLENYYDKYHNNLNTMCKNIIDVYNRCVIIDVHSFSKELLFALNIPVTKSLPDFCIGFEDDFCDYSIIQFIESTIKKNGFSVDFNYPYSGSIVPNNFYFSKDNRVKSTMIEINKEIYLNSNFTKSDNYNKIKNLTQEIINGIIFYETKKLE